MRGLLRPILAMAGAIAAATFLLLATGHAATPQVARGKYLVSFAGCNDCHTPGYFLGKPEMSRFLGGSEVGFEIPGLGTFYGPNLTPDKETGLGTWTAAQIAAALQTGVRPDGRVLAPAMPWRGYAKMTKTDAMAIAAYLKTLPPVKNKVPGPFGPNDTATSFVMKVIPPAAATASPKK